MNLMLRSIIYGLAFGIITSASGHAQAPPAQSGDKEALGKATVVGYVTNLNSFSFYRCRYVITTAQARSVEDAIQGKLIDAVSYENRLIVEGDRDLHEGLAPPTPPDFKKAKPIPGKPGLAMIPALTSSDHYLSSGGREMAYVPQLQTLILYSKEKGELGIPKTPLGMGSIGHRGRHGPAEMMADTEQYEMTTDGVEEVDGRPLVAVRFKFRQHKFARRYLFDPERGSLPIRIETWNEGKLNQQNFVTHVRECSHQRWFPERTVAVGIPNKEGSLFRVTEIKLLGLDADHRPTADEFAFTIPAGTSVHDHHNEDARKFFTLKQDEKIHVDDLPKLFTMVEQVGVTPLMDTAVPRSNSYGWLRWVGIVGGLALALGAVFLIWRRRRVQAA